MQELGPMRFNCVCCIGQFENQLGSVVYCQKCSLLLGLTALLSTLWRGSPPNSATSADSALRLFRGTSSARIPTAHCVAMKTKNMNGCFIVAVLTANFSLVVMQLGGCKASYIAAVLFVHHHGEDLNTIN